MCNYGTQHPLARGQDEPAPHPHWYHGKNPKIHLNWFLILQICRAWSKSGILNPNLTFFGLNMVAKRPRSKRWRYQYECWFTQWHIVPHLLWLSLCSTPQTPLLDPPLINCFKWSNSNLNSICLFHFLLQSKIIHYGNIGLISS